MKSISIAITFILVSIMFAPGVLAANLPPETLAWTTTADFNTGNKNDPGQDYFVANGVDQPTYTYISNPTAIYSSVVKKTFMVYQGGAGFQPYSVFFDHQTNTFSDPVQVNATNPVAGDGHGAPAMWIDEDGNILVFFGAHATKMQLRRSVNPYDISAWESLTTPSGTIFGPLSSSTYPHLFQIGNKIYFFYRNGTFNENELWGYRTSTTHGETWSAFTAIINFQTDTIDHASYVYDTKYVASQNRVYYTFVWDNRTEVRRHNVYVCYWDVASGNQFGMNGVNLGATVSLAEANTNCLVANTGTTTQAWLSKMKLDSANRPYILFNNGTNFLFNTTFTRWTGSSWTTPVVITSGDGLSDYVDMIVYSSTNIEAFIVTGGFRQFSVGEDDFSGDLERWTWDGVDWTFQENILTEAKAGNPVNRPSVPFNYKEPIRLVFDTWSPRGLLVPEAKMWAWGEDGFVFRPDVTSGTLGVETVTDNPSVPANGFVLANPRIETFGTDDSDAATYEFGNIKTGDSAGTITSVIDNGVYNVTSVEPAITTGRHGATLRSQFGVDGNWDIRYKSTVTNPEEGAGVLITTLCVYDQPDECDYSSETPWSETDGVWYDRLILDGDDLFEAVEVVDGTPALVGAGDTFACNPCWMRITKTGTLFTWFRSSDGVVWNQDEQATLSSQTSTKWFTHLGINSNSVFDQTWSIEADDFNIFSGTLDSDAFRPVGAWTSPIRDYTGNLMVPRNITVTFTGATANRFIDRIGIVDSDGDFIFVSETDLTSSGTELIEVPFDTDLRQDWHLKVELAGDGTGSLTVEELSVISDDMKTTTEEALNLFWLILFVFIIAAVLIAAHWFKRRRD